MDAQQLQQKYTQGERSFVRAKLAHIDLREPDPHKSYKSKADWGRPERGKLKLF
jgi:hypothetical protein